MVSHILNMIQHLSRLYSSMSIDDLGYYLLKLLFSDKKVYFKRELIALYGSVNKAEILRHYLIE